MNSIKLLVLTILFGVCFGSYAQAPTTIAELEQQKAKAAMEGDYKLAGELKQKIIDLKEMEKNDIEKAKIAKELKDKADLEEFEKDIKEALQKKKVQEDASLLEKNKKTEAPIVKQIDKPSEKETEILKLEKEKADAVAAGDYKLAGELKAKIANLKTPIGTEQNKIVADENKQSEKDAEIKKLENEKAKAVEDKDYKLAAELKKKILKLKGIDVDDSQKNLDASSQTKTNELAKLEKEKAEAVAAGNYKLAGELKSKIAQLNGTAVSTNNNETTITKNFWPSADGGGIMQEIPMTKDNKIDGLYKQYYKSGKLLMSMTYVNGVLDGITHMYSENGALLSKQVYINGVLNNDPSALKRAETNGNKGSYPSNNSIVTGTARSNNSTRTESNIIGNSNARISKAEANETSGVKYRRSSIYTLMINDPSRAHANTIQDAFVNTPVPEKFNNHNLLSAIIDAQAYAVDPLTNINSYLQSNQIAKELVAKWFNRNSKGEFDMELIKQRGEYNASNIDLNIAKNSLRGLALLSDAGEELIEQTYVVVNEFKYVNKEEVAQKTNTGLGIFKSALAFVPGASNVVNAASVAQVGIAVAGKGYVVKTTSYLFKLVWNPEVAADFYKNYYMDVSTYSVATKEAFDNATSFQLEYIGSESVLADLQSSIFTNKTEEELIYKATTKAVDHGIAKLQRKYEAFRTKTPIFSVDPITAKIGEKEGLEAGDKFEVLEQRQSSDGKIEYHRVGTIRVDGNNIWKNKNSIDELEAAGQNSSQGNNFTIFNGGSGYAPGMLIRQIN